MLRFEFDEKVAVEAILYLAHQSQDPTFHHLSKLMYFADRLHLERYGRFICGDQYIAMKHGPVPSAIYDMFKDVREGLSYINFPAADEAFLVEDYRVTPRRVPNLEWLSESDIECLEDVISQYDAMSFGELTSLSHDSAWYAADENEQISIESIVESFADSSSLLEYLEDPHP